MAALMTRVPITRRRTGPLHIRELVESDPRGGLQELETPRRPALARKARTILSLERMFHNHIYRGKIQEGMETPSLHPVPRRLWVACFYPILDNGNIRAYSEPVDFVFRCSR